MMAAAQLRLSPFAPTTTFSSSSIRRHSPNPFLPSITPLSTIPRPLSLSLFPTNASSASFPSPDLSSSGGDSGIGSGLRGTGGNGGDNDDGSGSSGDSHLSDGGGSDLGFLGLFLEGWRSRVAADPQFPFKVLMEELVGVSACVLGDMASRPNFGLNELDFVFSTLVVGSILNFVLMYLLAPTSASASAGLPSLFAACPSSHMFEPGPYSPAHRLGTFVYKGALFAAVGFAAGMVGTALSNGLIRMRKKMDPNFETPNKAPPTILNALTWAAHMGLSSNFRYQTLNGVEFVLGKALPPVAFKGSVVVLRCVNNLLGGVSFVVLARLTGSQKVEEKDQKAEAEVTAGSDEEKEKLVVVLEGEEHLQGNPSSSSSYK